MSLSTNITLTVNDYEIKLSRNLKFYENDQLKLIFTLNYWGIDNANGVTQKVLMPLNALSAVLFIETPLGVDSIESATIENNVVTFYLTSNQTQHIGVSRMQIQLSDADGCQITLPPMEFEVRENIYDNEVILSQVLLADENKNIVVSENGNAINTGTQLSAQTYAVALSAEDGTTTTTSQPTKQIKDFNLKTGVNGEENLLIQDSDGVTKRIKSSEFLNVNVDLTLYYTKEEVNTLLNNKANVSHTHTVADIEDMPDYALKTDIPSLDGYATETFVTNKIAEASLSGGEVDLSGLATKDELKTGLATKSNVGHIHEQYLTEHQDISMKADKTELHNHDNKTVLDGITSTKVTEWNNKSNFDGNYNSLTNKPTIPTVDVNKNYVDTQLATKANKSEIPSLEGYATETYVQNKIAEASLSGGEVDLSGYATKDELATKADISSIPTNTSQLTNDSGFITSVPSEYITESELDAKGYLTEHQDITGKADKIYVDTELAKKANISHTHSYNDLTDKPTIPGVDNLATKEELTNGLATKADVSHTHDEYLTSQDLSDYALKTEIPTVPTKTSQLTNDSGFINSIPSEYITETELNAKGYLTEHQDISGKANVSDLATVATSGDYNDLINTPTIPNEYTLPIASETTLGGIKVGSGLSIDRYGVLSATGTGGTGTGGTGTGGTGTGGTAGNGIIFNDSYIADCNRWLSNGYVKTGTSTINLPTLCTGVDKWGILFFIAENATNGTGTQMYFPIDGTYKGRVFTRSLTAIKQSGGSVSEWVLLTIQSDIPTLLSQLTNDIGFVKTSELSPVALSGNYNDLINKPTISGGGNVSSEAVINTKSITIDLDKYGIVEGDLSHKAPYSDEEYEIAYNNMEGFKTALNDLSSQGYSKIYLPRGTYIMCYRNPTGTNVWSYNRGWEITIPSHTDFDLNGSTIKVIYDSNNKNPYDLSTADAYKLCGMVFSFSKSYYSTLRNGTILGDRYERAFTNSSEVSIDYTYGVYITNGSSNCKIEDMEISGFMADSIGSDQNHNTDFGNSIVYTNVTFTNSSINVSNGTVESTPSSNYVFSSDYIDLSSIIATGCRTITLRTNIGYTYVFDADVSFKVFLYDENQTFIKCGEYDQTDSIPLTSNTAYCKISLVDYDKAGESTISPVFQLSPTSPEFLHVANCKIYNNHRGGLSNLPNDTTVERCEIFENGTAGTEDFPVFTDTTRYAINCEDHMIRNLVIKNNYIHDGYNGILLTCKNAVITENVMKNFPTSSVYSMYATNITVSNNKFENTKLPTVKSDTTKILASNNFFTNVSATTIQKNMLLNNNDITMKKMNITNSGQLSLNLGVVNEELSTDSVIGYGGIRGGFNNTIFNCVNPQVSTYYDVIELASNSSNNIINYEGLASDRQILPFSVYNSTLTNGKVSNNSANGNTFNLINSTINVKEFWETYYRAPGGSTTFNFKNCIINVPTEFSSTYFIALCNNNVYDGKGVFDITFDGCEINIDNTSFAYLIYIELWGGTSFTRLNLTIKNCVINNNTSNTLKLFMDGNNHLAADYCTLVLENNTYNGTVIQS